MPTDGSPRILITRLSHIGDCVLTLPLATAIKRHWPHAKVIWAVEKPSDQLLSLCPDLDEIAVVPKGWMGKPSAWWQVRKQLRNQKIDIAIDPQGITKSAMLAWLSGAKKRIGIRGRWGRELSPWLNNCLVTTTQDHLVDRSLELLSALDIANLQPSFELPVDPAALNYVNQFLADSGISKPFAILNPGCSWPSRRWDPERFAELANRLSSEHGVSSVVTWAGEKERQMALEIEKDTDVRCVMAPKTSLRELAALTHYESGPRFCVTADTGPMHIAAAMGSPCVGLFGTTRPQDSGAYGDQHVQVQAWYQSGSTRQRRTADNDAMRDITVEMALEACQSVLDSIYQKHPELRKSSDSSAA